MPNLIPWAAIYPDSDSDDEDEDSLPVLLPRARHHLEFSGDDNDDDDDNEDDDDDDDDDDAHDGNDADNDEADDDDDNDEAEAGDDGDDRETGDQNAGAVGRQPALPLPLVGDPDLPTHAYSFQDYAYSSSNGSTSDSSATPLSTIQVNNVSTFQIGEIQISTLDPSGPSGPNVGSSHEQVLESWQFLFKFPSATRPETEASNSSDPPPRFRQKTLLPINNATNLPFGDPLRKKTQGFKRFYYIIPNGISVLIIRYYRYTRMNVPSFS